MNWFPLPIFPEGSLASSVVTTVWVGVVVFCVTNLRFGWTFSGLVVPGYLVPLMIVKPWAAAVIVLEAVLTFWTVLAITKLMPKFKIACAFFGRDRFMAMIIVSAVYRVIGDTWLLPMLGGHLTERYGIDFDFRNNLHSFGLIVICLAANQLWKTGLVKGAVPFAFNILVTFVLVRYVLMEFTNFSISNLSFLYEDIAASIYAAPKAYIVLITTSILASRMNLLYGWDFNGIMIPALIALQFYEPIKVLTSFVEALVILGAAVLILKLPLFKSITIEGARKLLLFFTVSFVYKMAIGWGLLFAAPEVKVSDFYGFGYLLPTLMAIKMHQMGKVVHQVRITAQISLVSVVAANVVGFALTFLPTVATLEETAGSVAESHQFVAAELETVAERRFVDAHAAIGAGALAAPSPEEIYLFERGLEALSKFGSSGSDADFKRTQHGLAAAGFRVDRIGERYLHVAPVDPASGRPFLIIDRQTESGLAVECPRALDELDTFYAALDLFQSQSARVLAVAGAGAADSVREPGFGDYGAARSWLASIHRSFGRDGAIQVRRSRPGEGTRLFVKRALPSDLNLKTVEDRFGKFVALWEEPEAENPLRDASRSRFCELFLGDSALVPAGAAVPISELDLPVDALALREFYDFAPKATNLYQAPSAAELLHIDRHLLRPLFSLDAQNPEPGLARIRHHAAFYGFGVSAHRAGGELYVLLKESAPQHHWGGVLVRVGAASAESRPICLEVPSRVQDRSLLSFAATQFKRVGARALIVAGSNSLTNTDGGSALTVMPNRDSFFNLAHQAFVRGASSGDATVVQCRAFLPAPGVAYPEGDAILAAYRESRTAEQIRVALLPVVDMLESDGAEVVEVGEADESSPYAVGVNPQARYLDFSESGTFAILWLSPFLRENFQLQDENLALLKMLKVVGIPIREVSLSSHLEGKAFSPYSAVNERLKNRIRAFRERSDIHVLAGLSAEFAGGAFEAVLDPHSRQLFLICLDANAQPRLVANLSRGALEQRHAADTRNLEAFIDARAAWLELTSSDPD